MQAYLDVKTVSQPPSQTPTALILPGDKPVLKRPGNASVASNLLAGCDWNRGRFRTAHRNLGFMIAM